MVGWHHRLNGCEFEHTPGDSEGQGSLESCSPWGHKESDTAEPLNNNWQVGSCGSRGRLLFRSGRTVRKLKDTLHHHPRLCSDVPTGPMLRPPQT